MQSTIPSAYRKKSISFMPQLASDGQQIEAVTPGQRKNAGPNNAAAEQERDRLFNRFGSRSKTYKQSMTPSHLGSLAGAGGSSGG